MKGGLRRIVLPELLPLFGSSPELCCVEALSVLLLGPDPADCAPNEGCWAGCWTGAAVDADRP
jgi:hypothetical protein